VAADLRGGARIKGRRSLLTVLRTTLRVKVGVVVVLVAWGIRDAPRLERSLRVKARIRSEGLANSLFFRLDFIFNRYGSRCKHHWGRFFVRHLKGHP
jgi:hypothetical protein